MPRSRGRRKRSQKRRQSVTHGLHQPRHLMPDQPALIKRISEHPVMLLLGMLATIAVVFGLVHDALRAPEISADPIVDASQPFAFPFSIKNESWIFDMRDTGIRCGIDKIVLPNGAVILGPTMLDPRRVTIPPGGTGTFTCLIRTNGPAPSFAEGRALISVGYRTLWLFSRVSPETEFNWYTGGSPAHWVKGSKAN